MDLKTFRATRQVMPLAEALVHEPAISDMDLNPEFTQVAFYEGNHFILLGRRGGYLILETDEYETRDTALLEFLLWMWAYSEAQDLRQLIWG